jgi:hypothetical protein
MPLFIINCYVIFNTIFLDVNYLIHFKYLRWINDSVKAKEKLNRRVSKQNG